MCEASCVIKVICKWGVTSSEHSFWNRPRVKALEPGNVYSQNTQGIRSLYGLAVPDKEAPISCRFGEQILGFGSSYVAVTPRLKTWHPVCDPKKKKFRPQELRIWPHAAYFKLKPSGLSFSPWWFSSFSSCARRKLFISLVRPPCCAGRLPQLWTSSFERLREEGLAASRPAAARHVSGAANGDEGFHLIYRDPDHVTRLIGHQIHRCFHYIVP